MDSSPPPLLFELGSIIGFQVATIGIVVLLFAFFRHRFANRILISFGVTSFLYGLRLVLEEMVFSASPEQNIEVLAYTLSFMTYIIPIPLSGLLLLLFGRGWHGTLLWIFRAAIAFSILAISTEIVLQRPESVMAVNNVLVIVAASIWIVNIIFFRVRMSLESWIILSGFVVFGMFALNENLVELDLLPWVWSNETVGFLVLLFSLGYVAFLRYIGTEKQLLSIQYEVSAAQQIQNAILPHNVPLFRELSVSTRYVPMTTVAGDFYDYVQLDSNRIAFLIADVSGHGIGSALIASMLKVAFICELDRSKNSAEVMAGMNQTLTGRLGEHYVTAACLILNLENQQLEFSGAGHPPIFHFRAADHRIEEYFSEGLILGPFGTAEYQCAERYFASGDRLVMYTDGITEATNASDFMFESERLKLAIQNGRALKTEDFADSLLREVREWSNKKMNDCLDDDVTLIVIDIP
jgi:phosphoserine phosphatase RsbU/P